MNSTSGGTAQVPTIKEIRAEKDPIRQAVLAAMKRLLAGHPRHVEPDRQPTLMSLADEYGVDLRGESARGGKLRHHLYEEHSDLKDRFVYLTRQRIHPSVKEAELQLKLDQVKAEMADLRDLQTATRKDRDRWKTVAQQAIQILHDHHEAKRDQALREERQLRRTRKEGLTAAD